MKILSFNDKYTIKIGQNERENQNLLENVDLNDTWFHLSDYPSPHLVINVDFNLLTKKDIYNISVILKQHTKYRKENNISIDYTLRKNLEMTTKPGLVKIKPKGSKYYTINV
jgi:predicted ribosome quality control (RQC) complex YloA/Tae2 family protein